MPFIAGKSGNPLGRPKKPNIYTAYKDEYFNKRPKSNKRIMDNVYKAAEAGEPWAIKEWLRLYIPQATIHIDQTSTEVSEKRLLMVNIVKELSAEEKRSLYQMLTQKKPETVTVDAEVIESELCHNGK